MLPALDQLPDFGVFVDWTIVHHNYRVLSREWVHVWKKVFDESFECFRTIRSLNDITV